MTARAPKAAAVRGHRPRDRKSQIVAAAAPRFYAVGYHNVGTEEIATAVGITAAALYRHFGNKRELLAATINHGLERAADAVTSAAPGGLDAVLTALVEVAVARRDLGVLWNRESRHLEPQQRDNMRAQFFVVPKQLTDVLHAVRPALPENDANFLAWAVLAVLTSPSYHATAASTEQYRASLHRMAHVVCTADTLRGDESTGRQTAPETTIGLPRTTRREILLAAAITLFSQRGYHAVSIEDVGAAAGVASARIYDHFTAKSDLLVAVLTRAAESLQIDLGKALATARTPKQALASVARSYIHLVLSHPDLIGTLIAEVTNLPEAQRHSIRQLQHDYVTEWVRLLTEIRPDLDDTAARFLTHGVLTVINDIGRTKHLAARTHVATELYDLTRAMLENG